LETAVAGQGEALVDPDQLRQALENVVRNAVEATPEGGHVVITVRSRADRHEIEVTDTGCGIPPEDLPRLFDLYFTTKKDGTGVGLAVTQQIVTAHGGTIEVDSEPGRGTRMTVKLPAAREGQTDD
jgi:signal transduction histidine kinase